VSRRAPADDDRRRLRGDLEPPWSDWRDTALLPSAEAHLLTGDTDQVLPLFSEASTVGASLGNTDTIVDGEAELALEAMERGRWPEAAERVQHALVTIETHRMHDYAASVLAFAAAACLAVHRGDLTEAGRQLTRAMRARPACTFVLPFLAVRARLHLAKAHATIGDHATARHLLREIDDVLRRRPALGALVDEVTEFRGTLMSSAQLSAAGASPLTPAELRLLPCLQMLRSLLGRRRSCPFRAGNRPRRCRRRSGHVGSGGPECGSPVLGEASRPRPDLWSRVAGVLQLWTPGSIRGVPRSSRRSVEATHDRTRQWNHSARPECGATSEFSLFFRVKDGQAQSLRAALLSLQDTPGYRPGDYGMAIQTIHEARFVLFDDDTQLAFITSFDGPWDAYMEDFFTSGPTLALFDAIFHHVEGYDGLPNVAAVRDFVLGAEHSAVAYARNYGGTVKEIRKAQRVNRAFQQVLDHPQAAEILEHPALRPLLDEAAD
jgi:hypothetical protein